MINGVEFDEDYTLPQRQNGNSVPESPSKLVEFANKHIQPASDEKGLSAWLIRKGFAKSKESAEMIIIGIIIINLIISISIVFATISL